MASLRLARTRRPRLAGTALLAVAGTLALAGCSGGTDADSGKIRVVTSTNVYADIVRHVAGDHAEVTAIIDSSSQDPHGYEATPQDKVRIQKADLLVANGGGYDPFMDDMSQGADGQKIEAVDVAGHESASASASSGHDHSSEENEHVWYDLHAMEELTEQVAQALGEKDSDHRQDYEDNAKKYSEQIQGIADQAAALKGQGKKYLATEPVPDYLLDATGMTDATPAAFTEAVEAESDVPAQTLKSVQDQIAGKQLALLAFNPQTETDQTKDLKARAAKAGVRTADFTETLPEGKDYVSWMRENVDQVRAAL